MVSHRFFSLIENQLGGIEEYVALDKLLEVGQSGKYDFCVLDTPPAQHAIEERHALRGGLTGLGHPP